MENEDELDEEDRIFETLPQEWQDKIDNEVSENIKRVEEVVKPDFLSAGHRYTG